VLNCWCPRGLSANADRQAFKFSGAASKALHGVAPCLGAASLMSLRPLFSKLLFWLAALSGLASLWLPDPLGSRLATLALGAAACSLLVWRGWRPGASTHAAAAPPPVSSLDDGGMLEAAAQVARCCANAADLSEALRGVGHILAHELGARHILVALVEFVGPGASDVRLKPLLDLAPPRLQRAGMALSDVAASALRERGVVTDPSSGYALAVLESAKPVGLIEFEILELAVEALALTRFLELVRSELNDVAQRSRSNPGGFSPARLRVLRAQSEAPDFLAAVALDRQVSLFVIEPQGLRIVALSRRAEREFGLRRARVIGKTVAQSFGETIGQAAMQAMRRTIDAGKIVEQEVHWATPRGQRGANVSLCALRHADGSPRLLIAMARALHSDMVRGGERRVMPRHGLLRDDAPSAAARSLPRPIGATARRARLKD
jgi:PAS domain-containing protein